MSDLNALKPSKSHNQILRTRGGGNESKKTVNENGRTHGKNGKRTENNSKSKNKMATVDREHSEYKIRKDKRKKKMAETGPTSPVTTVNLKGKQHIKADELIILIR